MWHARQAAATRDGSSKLCKPARDAVTAILALLEALGPQRPFAHSSDVEGSRHSHRRG